MNAHTCDAWYFGVRSRWHWQWNGWLSRLCAKSAAFREVSQHYNFPVYLYIFSIFFCNFDGISNVGNNVIIMAALRIAESDADIIFSSCGFFYLSSFISSPNFILSGQRLDVYHTSTHGVALVQNLERRSETCCARLAKNTGHKKVSKDRHLGTIAQFCRAISSQLKHISTIGKSC